MNDRLQMQDVIVNTHKHMDSVMISEQKIKERVFELAKESLSKFNSHECIFLPCFTGAMFFATDFLRAREQISWIEREEKVVLELNGSLDDVGSCFSTSYAHGTVCAEDDSVSVHLKGECKGKKAVIIEDIVDTGGTLVRLAKALYAEGCTEVHVVSLLNKQARRKAEHEEKLRTLIKTLTIGFEIEVEFVVGYGLDFNGLYRCLPYIGVLHPELYK